jgi:hypothetical protein
MNRSVKTGAMIAFAAASLFSSACGKKADNASSTMPASDTAAAPAEQTAKVACLGINECKGKGSCKTADNGCAGSNECKGKGLTEVASADDCTGKGGTVAAGM